HPTRNRATVRHARTRSLVAALLGMTVPLGMRVPPRTTAPFGTTAPSRRTAPSGRWIIRLMLTATLGLAACGRPPAQQADEAKQKLRSWDATMALLEQERAGGALPEEFAQQVRRAAGEERRKAQAQLRKAGGT